MASALGKGDRRVPSVGAGRSSGRSLTPSRGVAVPSEQLPLFSALHPVVERLLELDINTMTPLQALAQLARLADEARSGQRHA